MSRLRQSHLRSYLLLVAAAAVLPATALHFTAGAEPPTIGPAGHLWMVAVVAAIALVASIGLLIAGVHDHDGRAALVGGAFAVMSLLFALHGLATPGVLFAPNGVIALAGGIALPLGAVLLTLAAVPSLNGPDHVRAIGVGYVVLLVGLAGAGGIALAIPSLVPSLPRPGSLLATLLFAVGIAFFAIVAWRAVRTWALTRRFADLCVGVGVVWLGVALVPQLLIGPGGWPFWIGHVIELGGVALVGIPLMADAYRGRPSHAAVGDFAPSQLVADEEAFLGARVRVLMGRLEEKDPSTEQHTRRVAEWAVQIGEELGLAPARLRDLALAGLLHDIGKLSVPTPILVKPGALTDDEFAVIKRHPVWGDELVAELGYPDRIRRPVRGHHERLDGRGYPDGLSGDALDLETRILAVADVYDALVSPRVYRAAWDRERALQLLRDGVGTQFDARCVAALERRLGAVVLPLAA